MIGALGTFYLKQLQILSSRLKNWLLDAKRGGGMGKLSLRVNVGRGKSWQNEKAKRRGNHGSRRGHLEKEGCSEIKNN